MLDKYPGNFAALLGNNSALMSLKNLRVLAIDDDKDTRKLLRQVLISLGINNIHEASNGAEGIEAIKKSYEPFDIILCDWVMPYMDGAEVLTHVRKLDPHIPFIMITGLNDEQSVLQARDAGVSAYITKPIAPKQLEARIRIARLRSQNNQNQTPA